MVDKTNFTSDEWTLLLESVMMAGMAVTAAEPSGLWGLLKESFASAEALAKVKLDNNSDPLVKAVVDDFGTSTGRSAARDGLKAKLAGASPSEIKARCIETLSQVSTLLDTKAPADAPAFKAWLRQISQGVAEAASEGGFFSSGVQVSDAEKATLTEISSALKLAA
ncbi:hypothetical protein [Pseudorhodoplanes sinuspersici]|uniref:Uncharacterized protein n=1 Tax=Pseudorhodoplanes sinuspersici TaxID=1235591 RepID=A0A1W6ZY73_9HYPH|nr:hypothetical protein [Pseudorhodoplanes sinuspersici]ARQ01695.1 hypothetical protein CAK95_23260 [Pseudorhodoplanes sinuspersici]RKE73424.1 hypothetical protein DFP91_1310 [Pseudorhodoplanes sinuspersici]